MEQFWSGTLENLAANVIAAFLGVVAAWFVRRVWEQWRYGGWQVVVVKGGAEKLRRPVSVGKAKEVLEEPAELSVFLKGVASPYGWINCDIIQEGEALGLLKRDRTARTFTIDLDRNPAGAPVRPAHGGPRSETDAAAGAPAA